MVLDSVPAERVFPVVSDAANYLATGFIPSVLSGDVFSIAIAAVLVIFLLIVFFQAAVLIFSFVKRFFLALIVVISLFLFAVSFRDKIFSPQPDPLIITVGILGLLVGLAAIIISLLSFREHFTRFRKGSVRVTTEKESGVPEAYVPKVYTIESLRQPLREQLQTDRSLLAVLSYVIIAQFGIFSSPTLSAPSIPTGIAFLVVFLLGAGLFIKTSYHVYARGVLHLVASAVFGVILSVILAHYWANIPFGVLLSLEYFTSPSLVAFVTGIAVSLLMGTKN